MSADIKYLIELAEDTLKEVKAMREELSEVSTELKEIKQQLLTAPEGA